MGKKITYSEANDRTHAAVKKFEAAVLAETTPDPRLAALEARIEGMGAELADYVTALGDASNREKSLQAENERLREALERVDVDLRYFDHRDTGQKINRAPKLTAIRDAVRFALAPRGDAEGGG